MDKLNIHALFFLDIVCTKLTDFKPVHVLFVYGDYNCTENSSLDRNYNEPHPVSQSALRQLVHTHGLVDIWRSFHVNECQYTWSHMGIMLSP